MKTIQILHHDIDGVYGTTGYLECELIEQKNGIALHKNHYNDGFQVTHLKSHMAVFGYDITDETLAHDVFAYLSEAKIGDVFFGDVGACDATEVCKLLSKDIALILKKYQHVLGEKDDREYQEWQDMYTRHCKVLRAKPQEQSA